MAGATDPARVRFEELPLASGRCLAVATLDSEETLNALSLAMALALDRQLAQWAGHEDIVCVLLRGAGERAFSAGGDIQDLYRAMVRNHAVGATVDDTPDRFFEAEYRLDYRIHTLPKPVVAFGCGFVMGGGLGLYSAARVRVVTPTTRIAMPEVTIGLFPDAGATWILRGLPPHLGLFLGATGTRMDAADALYAGLGTHFAPSDCDPVAALVAADGDPDRAFDASPGLEPGGLQAAEPAIREAFPGIPVDGASARAGLETLAGASDWFERGLATMRGGCPTTVGIVCEQLRRAPALDLADCFRMEMVIASNCARFADFAEGVRALIVHKDGAPRWRSDGAHAHVLAHFEPPWETNPLSDLGRTGT